MFPDDADVAAHERAVDPEVDVADLALREDDGVLDLAGRQHAAVGQRDGDVRLFLHLEGVLLDDIHRGPTRADRAAR